VKSGKQVKATIGTESHHIGSVTSSSGRGGVGV